MLKVPIGRIGSIDMQFYASLEDLDGLLPVEVVVTDEGRHAPLEILQPILMMITVATSLLVKGTKTLSIPWHRRHKKLSGELQGNLKPPDQTPVVVEFEAYQLK